MTQEIQKRIEQIRRGEIPEGYKKTKVGIVPEEWEEGFLGNYIQEYKELSNDIEKYPVYSSSRQGLIPQSLYFDNREAVETNLGYKIVPNGYVTYRHMSDDDLFHFNVNNTGGEILVSSEYPVFSSTKKSSLGYIIPMLNDTARFRYFCRTQKMGGTRTRLYYKNLCNYKSVFPSLAEQEKIVEILQAQDNLIELQQKKIDELKCLKKGYLSKMFPQKGCNVPEIRFPGFTDPWKQRKLGDVVQITMGQSPDGSTYSDEPSDYILVQGNADLQNGWVCPRIWTTQITKKADAGDLIMSVRAPAGAMGKTAYNAVIGRGVAAIKGNEFIYQLLVKMDADGFWKTLSCGSTFESLNSDNIKNAEVKIPTTAEQIKIGDYFQQLDNLITLHQRKCDEEKQKKKALMQLLLTGIVRTNK